MAWFVWLSKWDKVKKKSNHNNINKTLIREIWKILIKEKWKVLIKREVKTIQITQRVSITYFKHKETTKKNGGGDSKPKRMWRLDAEMQ